MRIQNVSEEYIEKRSNKVILNRHMRGIEARVENFVLTQEYRIRYKKVRVENKISNQEYRIGYKK